MASLHFQLPLTLSRAREHVVPIWHAIAFNGVVAEIAIRLQTLVSSAGSATAQIAKGRLDGYRALEPYRTLLNGLLQFRK